MKAFNLFVFIAFAAGLTGCADIVPVSKPEAVATTQPSVSAESRRLQKYYANVQSRLLTQGLLRTDGGGPDAPFDATTLARNFEKIALFDEYAVAGAHFVAQQTPSTLRRWEKPIRMEIVFGDLVPQARREKDRANVIAYAARLSRLTGVKISITNKNPNFHVLFLNRDEQKAAGPSLRKMVPRISPIVVREIAESPRNTFCVAYAFSNQGAVGTYDSAIILIKSEHTDLMRLSCIHEEMAQAMGLANDSPKARPSIFNDDEEFALLTHHDELLLKMLYDPRLKLGMTPQSARAILPTIAEEVLNGSG